MKTGFGAYTDSAPTAPLTKLVLGFIAVFERQVICRAHTYMYHNYLEGQEAFDTSTMESLKFSTLSPNGVACALRDHLTLAFEQGFLSEEDCGDNLFARRALSLFPEIHAAWETGGEQAAQAWVQDYVTLILTDPSVCVEEALLAGDVDEESSAAEEGESAEDEEDQDEEDQDEEDDRDDDEEVECTCDFCEEFRGYANVDMSQVVAHTPIDAILIDSVKKAFLKQ